MHIIISLTSDIFWPLGISSFTIINFLNVRCQTIFTYIALQKEEPINITHL